MLRLLSDHNFNGRILRALIRRIPDLEVVRAIDVGLARAEDPDLLEWAAEENRVVLSHDVNTVSAFANDRIRVGLPMPGVFLVPKDMPIGQAIDDLEMAVTAQIQDDCQNQLIYFPLWSIRRGTGDCDDCRLGIPIVHRRILGRSARRVPGGEKSSAFGIGASCFSARRDG